MNFLKKLFAKAFRRGASIEEIISPIRLIAANLAEYEKQKADAATKAETEVLKLSRQITDDMAEARRAGALAKHYQLLVNGFDADYEGGSLSTAVAAE